MCGEELYLCTTEASEIANKIRTILKNKPESKIKTKNAREKFMKNCKYKIIQQKIKELRDKMDVWVNNYKDLRILESNSKRKLNAGCGFIRKEGYINIDFLKSVEDIIANIEALPFKNNTLDLIYSRHVLEHVDNFVKVLEEFHRVLKEKGKLYVVVPHAFSYSFAHPDHKRNFNIFSFDNFDKRNKKTFEISKIEFKIIKVKYRYIKPKKLIKRIIISLISMLSNNHQAIYEKNFAHLFPPYEIEFILQKS